MQGKIFPIIRVLQLTWKYVSEHQESDHLEKANRSHEFDDKIQSPDANLLNFQVELEF